MIVSPRRSRPLWLWLWLWLWLSLPPLRVVVLLLLRVLMLALVVLVVVVVLLVVLLVLVWDVQTSVGRSVTFRPLLSVWLTSGDKDERAYVWMQGCGQESGIPCKDADRVVDHGNECVIRYRVFVLALVETMRLVVGAAMAVVEVVAAVGKQGAARHLQEASGTFDVRRGGGPARARKDGHRRAASRRPRTRP